MILRKQYKDKNLKLDVALTKITDTMFYIPYVVCCGQRDGRMGLCTSIVMSHKHVVSVSYI